MIEKQVEQEIIQQYTCHSCNGEGEYAIHPWDDWEDFKLCDECGGCGYLLVYQGKVIRDYIPGLEVK